VIETGIGINCRMRKHCEKSTLVLHLAVEDMNSKKPFRTCSLYARVLFVHVCFSRLHINKSSRIFTSHRQLFEQVVEMHVTVIRTSGRDACCIHN
jgi:hypothetical protein